MQQHPFMSGEYLQADLGVDEDENEDKKSDNEGEGDDPQRQSSAHWADKEATLIWGGDLESVRHDQFLDKI